MSGWNVEQRKFLINIDYCLSSNLVCLAVVANIAISPDKLQFFTVFQLIMEREVFFGQEQS